MVDSTPTLGDPVMEMKRAVVALHVQVPEDVATDVRNRWNAVAGEVKALRAVVRDLMSDYGQDVDWGRIIEADAAHYGYSPAQALAVRRALDNGNGEAHDGG